MQRYLSLGSYTKEKFGTKLYKLALDGGFTCPNRDGTLGTRGCIFCSGRGSGDFAESTAEGVAAAIERAKGRVAHKNRGGGYIAYFQSYTATYAPTEKLEALFTAAIQCEDVRVLSVATRPDCLGDETVALLKNLNEVKPVWVELGLQTIHPDTAALIRANMDAYMKEGVLENKGEGFVLVKRTCAGKTRVGLVMALDLEAYDYTKGSETLIRASEGTIVERIPPRLRIRWGAPLEMPHILVLIDDPNRTVIEPFANNSDKLEKLYDFDLMQNGGHIEGYFVNDPAEIEKTIACIDHLKVEFAERYGADRAPMLFAMGDGNHSFATAKANWEKLKAELPESERENHPARYALVEIENVHDEGIVFEPIHRVVFGIEKDKALNYLSEKLNSANGSCELKIFATRAEMEAAMANECKCSHILPVVYEGGFGYFKVKDPAAQLAVGTLQNAIDSMLKEFAGSSVDYIHGADVVLELGSKPGNMGFLLPPMAKSAFFDTVVYDGALPRKTFSMGEAE